MEMFKIKVSLKTALVLSYLFLAGLIVFTIMLSLSTLNSMERHFVTLGDEVYPRLNLSRDLVELVTSKAVVARNIVLERREDIKELELKRYLALTDDVSKKMNIIKARLLTDKSVASDTEEKILEDILADSERYTTLEREAVDLALVDMREDSFSKMSNVCAPLLKELMEKIARYASSVQSDATARISASKISISSSRAFMYTMLVVVIGLAFSIGTLISYQILQRLGADPKVLSDSVAVMAAGDLTSEADISSASRNSVYGKILEMRTSFVGSIVNVRRSYETSVVSCNDISAMTKALSDRTAQQVASITDALASLHYLGECIKSTSAATHSVTKLSARSNAAATDGTFKVNELVATMAEISRSSAKIAEIIELIESISFQTSILALNAAVEAARAGEQGRGFAVVAAEVRALAGRAADAAKTVDELIKVSHSCVLRGNSQVAECHQKMAEIQSQISKVSAVAADIKSNSEQELSESNNLLQFMSKLDIDTQENASFADDVNKTCERLQAEMLAVLGSINKFSV